MQPAWSRSSRPNVLPRAQHPAPRPPSPGGGVADLRGPCEIARERGKSGTVGPPCAARLAQVIDLKAARQDPDRYREALRRRGAADDLDALLAADARWREHTERAEGLRATQKKSSRGRPPSPEEIE